MMLILLHLLCNHDDLILKLHQNELATMMKGGFLWVVSKLEVYQERNISSIHI